MGFSKETTLYFFCWADSPITIQYEIWAIKIKWNSDKQTSLKVKDISIKTSNYNFGNNMGGVITNIPCKSLIGDFEKILNAEIATWSACNTHTIIMLDSKGTYLTIWQAEKTSESELEIRFVYV